MRTRHWLLAAVAGAAVVAAARGRRPVGATAITSTSRRERTTAMAALVARRAADRGVTVARSALADDAVRRRLRAGLERREADDVVASLGNMKGALMKLGQMASYLDEGMPEAMREALAQLRQDAPPMQPDLALTEIERGIGRPLSDAFAHVDEDPLAAASIGQVHRATTADGRDVAVKVQYPGIADAIGADLDNTDALATVLGWVFPGLESDRLVTELRARISEELDYEHEATNQRLFADFFRGHPHIWVPDVIDDLSSATVLTTEFVPARRFDDIATLPAADRARVAEIVYRFVFRSLNRLYVFNGDPHPGNYLLADDGRVAFVDFGLVKHFDHDEIDQFASLIRAMIDGDRAVFRRTAERVAVLQPDAPFSDDEIYEWFAAYYELILDDAEVTVTTDYASRLLRQTFDARTNEILRYANVPPTFALIQRINLGLFSILARLEATANWRRISEELWAWVDGPPSTPMGHDEAAWLAAR